MSKKECPLCKKIPKDPHLGEILELYCAAYDKGFEEGKNFIISNQNRLLKEMMARKRNGIDETSYMTGFNAGCERRRQSFEDGKKAGMAWLPIEEAPKDESEILLISKYKEIQVGFWYENEDYKMWCTRNDEGTAEISNPTHFMPLPPPPC